MSADSQVLQTARTHSLHRLGVVCGLAAGAWLGAAEAPTKLVGIGLSPYLISVGMVAGVFVARWTVPMIVKGTGPLILDIRAKPHLVVWAILAGILWAAANTLTVFAIKAVGLSVAFPLWNTNSLVGLLWGWLLFGELRGAGAKQWIKVAGGCTAIVAGTILLARATLGPSAESSHAAAKGVLAALGASLLWGTMYIPYRKAYISGMSPLSFVTIFTFGELATVLLLALTLNGGLHRLASELNQARPALFWLFLGGFCWVIGDLFQQYAAKYIGISRGIPLSNTDQLWGLAWGALVFTEGSGQSGSARLLIVAGSLLMIAGALSIGLAEAPESEQIAGRRAMQRECDRYGLDPDQLAASLAGKDDSGGQQAPRRSRWELLIAAIAVAIFVWLGTMARPQPIPVNFFWMAALGVATLGVLAIAGRLLWQRTRFS
jgi:drug/metabolite transporter (DMT)-like permease